MARESKCDVRSSVREHLPSLCAARPSSNNTVQYREKSGQWLKGFGKYGEGKHPRKEGRQRKAQLDKDATNLNLCSHGVSLTPTSLQLLQCTSGHAQAPLCGTPNGVLGELVWVNASQKLKRGRGTLVVPGVAETNRLRSCKHAFMSKHRLFHALRVIRPVGCAALTVCRVN